MPGGESPTSTSNESEPVRFGPFPSARVAETGGISFEQETWTTSAKTTGSELVAYDLSPWAPLGGALQPDQLTLEVGIQCIPIQFFTFTNPRCGI